MGINVHGARALCFARRLGADFAQTATIARQGLAVSRGELTGALGQFGPRPSEADVDRLLTGADGYGEALLGHLGASEVHSFDVSPYEGATFLHDMNQPISAEFKNRYTVVFDSGSLEHIFNVPIAIKNCMEMVKVGGHYISILPANNFFGHGFYQFSPELFFNIFDKSNGFQVEAMIAFDDRPDRRWHAAKPHAQWFAVRNPLDIGERVTLANRDPISLIVVAKRLAEVEIFSVTPQQSDYAAIWRADAERKRGAVGIDSPPQRRPLAIRLAKTLPLKVRLALRRAMQRPPKPIGEGFDRRFFEPIDPLTVRPPVEPTP